MDHIEFAEAHENVVDLIDKYQWVEDARGSSDDYDDDFY